MQCGARGSKVCEQAGKLCGEKKGRRVVEGYAVGGGAVGRVEGAIRGGGGESPGVERGDGFETPFFEGDAVEELVPVHGALLLPTFVVRFLREC